MPMNDEWTPAQKAEYTASANRQWDEIFQHSKDLHEQRNNPEADLAQHARLSSATEANAELAQLARQTAIATMKKQRADAASAGYNRPLLPLPVRPVIIE
jgi:hypothetical protein